MKKRIIYILFLCSFFSLSLAQSVSYSKPVRLTNKVSRFRILGKNLNYIVAERWGAKAHYIDLYNADLKHVSTKPLPKAKDEKIHRIWLQPTQSWVFYSKAHKGYVNIEAKKMDARFNLKTSPLRLDSLVERRDLVETNLRFALSLNERFIANYLPIFSNGKVQEFRVNIWNRNLEKVQVLRLKNKAVKEGKFMHLLVQNDGSVVLVFKAKDKQKSYSILYAKPNATLKQYQYESEFESFKRLRFEIDNKTEELIVAGFRKYSVSKREIASDAFFTQKINLKNGKVVQTSVEEFTNELYKMLTGKDSPKPKVVLQTFYINKILPKVDKSYLVFAESFYKNEETVEVAQNSFSSGSSLFGSASLAPSSYKTNHYHYNDIITYHIDSVGKINKVNVMNKRQHSVDDRGGYSSFMLVNQQDKLDVLFLDDIRTDASLKRYNIDKESESFNDFLMNIAQNEVMPVVKKAVQTAPNEILLPSYFRGSFSIVKIVFEDQ